MYVALVIRKWMKNNFKVRQVHGMSGGAEYCVACAVRVLGRNKFQKGGIGKASIMSAIIIKLKSNPRSFGIMHVFNFH